MTSANPHNSFNCSTYGLATFFLRFPPLLGSNPNTFESPIKSNTLPAKGNIAVVFADVVCIVCGFDILSSTISTLLAPWGAKSWTVLVISYFSPSISIVTSCISIPWVLSFPCVALFKTTKGFKYLQVFKLFTPLVAEYSVSIVYSLSYSTLVTLSLCSKLYPAITSLPGSLFANNLVPIELGLSVPVFLSVNLNVTLAFVTFLVSPKSYITPASVSYTHLTLPTIA